MQSYFLSKVPLIEKLLSNPTILFETLSKTPAYDVLGDFFMRFHCTPVSEAVAERWIKYIKHKVAGNRAHTNVKTVLNSLRLSSKAYCRYYIFFLNSLFSMKDLVIY
jgi:hypothetical protein